MKLGDVHPDMERFLQEDCYCPGEIYDVTGFFYEIFKADDECKVIEGNDKMTAVVATSSWENSLPQAILFWHDDGNGKIIDAQRVDATENNIGILRTIVQGGKSDGRKLDEYKPGSTKKSLEKVLSIADAVIVD